MFPERKTLVCMTSQISRHTCNQSLDKLTVIGTKSFCECRSLRSICLPDSFFVIKAKAFAHCISLKHIIVPRSVRALSRGWSEDSSFEFVTFESASSLRKMINGCSADLRGDFRVEIA
jgi:hypothetical protein